MTILQEGSLARVIRDTVGPEKTFFPQGFEFIVEDYVDADASETGKAFYWGSTSQNYNNVTMWADAVEEAMTVDQMNNRKAPTVKEIAEHIAVSVRDRNASFEVNETYYSAENIVEICGETHEGLHFIAYVKVLDVAQNDD